MVLYHLVLLANQATAFAITDTKLYVHVVTLSTQDNAKLLQQSFLKEQSTEITTIQKQQISIKNNNTDTQPILRLLSWSKFSGSQ